MILTTSFKLPRQQRQQTPLLKVICALSWLQWSHFLAGYLLFVLLVLLVLNTRRFLAWSCDAMDFYSVSLSLTSLSSKFGKDTQDIVRFGRTAPV